jgi:hypothetical protein
MKTDIPNFQIQFQPKFDIEDVKKFIVSLLIMRFYDKTDNLFLHTV